MNKFENLQSSINGTQFIKSYPMLNNLAITPSQKSFIELVLSFQNQGLEFFMEYSEIAELLGVKKQSVSNLVKSLKSIEYISTKNSSRFNGKFIGSTTFITINEDKILSDISEPKEIKKEVPKKASKEAYVKSEVITSEVIKEASQSMFGEQRDIFQELEEYNSEANDKPLIKDTYSNIIFKGFFIKEKHLGVWDLIQGYKGVMNKLNNYFKQIDFDLEMDKNYESYKNKVIEIN